MMTQSLSDLSDQDLLLRVLTGGCPHPENCARHLLTEFGSVRRALGVEEPRLRRALTTCPATLHQFLTLRELGLRSLRQDLARVRLGSFGEVCAYLTALLACRTTEQVRIIYFDKALGVIADEGIDGTIDHAPLYVREVVGRALEIGAASLIIAHNHPSGLASFSHADIQITETLVWAFSAFEILVHDHFLVTVSGCVSMKQLGIMPQKSDYDAALMRKQLRKQSTRKRARPKPDASSNRLTA